MQLVCLVHSDVFLNTDLGDCASTPVLLPLEAPECYVYKNN